VEIGLLGKVRIRTEASIRSPVFASNYAVVINEHWTFVNSARNPVDAHTIPLQRAGSKMRCRCTCRMNPNNSDILGLHLS
jgi:hypothetical protein